MVTNKYKVQRRIEELVVDRPRDALQAQIRKAVKLEVEYRIWLFEQEQIVRKVRVPVYRQLELRIRVLVRQQLKELV